MEVRKIFGSDWRWSALASSEVEHGLEVAAAVGSIAHRRCLLFAVVELARQVRESSCEDVSGGHDSADLLFAPKEGHHKPG